MCVCVCVCACVHVCVQSHLAQAKSTFLRRRVHRTLAASGLGVTALCETQHTSLPTDSPQRRPGMPAVGRTYVQLVPASKKCPTTHHGRLKAHVCVHVARQALASRSLYSLTVIACPCLCPHVSLSVCVCESTSRSAGLCVFTHVSALQRRPLVHLWVAVRARKHLVCPRERRVHCLRGRAMPGMWPPGRCPPPMHSSPSR